MTPLPALPDAWAPTHDALHTAAQTLGALRKARVPSQPNALHLALYADRDGASTGDLGPGDAAVLDVRSATLRLTRAGVTTAIPLTGHTAADLLDELARTYDLPRDVLRIERPTDQPLQPDAVLSAAYADVLDAVVTGLARAHARLLGGVTPLVLWPHGFDWSTLWFPGSVPDESSQPHVATGFSPGSAGLPRPYLYAYASPAPADDRSSRLPAPARWHTQGWTGIVADYDDWRAADDPATTVEHLADGMIRALYP